MADALLSGQSSRWARALGRVDTGLFECEAPPMKKLVVAAMFSMLTIQVVTPTALAANAYRG